MPIRKALSRREGISENKFKYLNDDHPDPGNDVEIFMWRAADIEKLWRELRTEILAAWSRNRPCTRPSCWWKYEAPGPRKRLGGRGVPKPEALSYAPELVRGIPAAWIEALDVRLWPELADKQVDPKDPPTFESEAAFLQRMGLLSATEQRHLRQHPELLEHERINLEEEDDKDAV